MKKFINLAILAAFILGTALLNNGFGGIKKYIYQPITTDTIVLTGATDSGYFYLPQFPLYDNSHGNDITKYNKFMICYHFNAASENLDVSGVAGENNTDSVIVTTYFGSPYEEIALYTDTCATLPCTCFHAYDENLMYAGVYGSDALAAADSASDSVWSGGYWAVNDSVLPALWMDYFYFEVYCTDTAAHNAADTLEFIFDYWYKFFEDKD
jgi:hypothetical protein